MKCENCVYFGYSDNEDWKDRNGKNICHCMFRELRGEWETAPCDEPEYEDNDDEYYGRDDVEQYRIENPYHANPLDDDDFDTDDYVFDIPSDAF